MIQEKFYRQQEDRDPSIYLGIDDNLIPFDLFTGVYNEKDMVFTDDVWSGIQFLVCDEGVLIVKSDENRDLYVTKEDIQSNDRWYKIGHALGEYSTHICGIPVEREPINKLHLRLMKRYLDGERGELSETEKVYDEEGIYYMWHSRSFNTEKYENETFFSQVRRHTDFVSNYEQWNANDFEMLTNEIVWKELLDAVGAMSPISYGNSFQSTPLNEEEVASVTSIYDPRLGGKINFVEDERNDFILKIKEA